MVACFRKIAALSLAACFAACLPAQAQEWSGALVAASDMVYRGISQSRGRAGLMLDVSRASEGGWNASAGLAAPRDPDRAYGSAELTVSLDKSWALDNDWTMQTGITHYQQLGRGRARHPGHDELTLALGWRGRLLASVALSPNTRGYGIGYGRRGRAAAYALSVNERLVGRVAFNAGLGYYDLAHISAHGYAYGSVGLSWHQGGFEAYLSRIDSRAAEQQLVWAALAGGRWVGALMWRF